MQCASRATDCVEVRVDFHLLYDDMMTPSLRQQSVLLHVAEAVIVTWYRYLFSTPFPYTINIIKSQTDSYATLQQFRTNVSDPPTNVGVDVS